MPTMRGMVGPVARDQGHISGTAVSPYKARHSQIGQFPPTVRTGIAAPSELPFRLRRWFNEP